MADCHNHKYSVLELDVEGGCCKQRVNWGESKVLERCQGTTRLNLKVEVAGKGKLEHTMISLTNSELQQA